MRLTVYSRDYCSLCHDMVAALEALQPDFGFDLEVIDVDDDEALEARYGTRVPVLTGEDGSEICHYRLDGKALESHLSGR